MRRKMLSINTQKLKHALHFAILIYHFPCNRGLEHKPSRHSSASEEKASLRDDFCKLLQKEQSSWNTRLSQADGFFRSLPKGRGRGLLPFAELLEGRPDDAAALHHAVPAHPHVRQVPADDAVIHNDCLQKDTQLNPLPLPPVVHLLHKLMPRPGHSSKIPLL